MSRFVNQYKTYLKETSLKVSCFAAFCHHHASATSLHTHGY